MSDQSIYCDGIEHWEGCEHAEYIETHTKGYFVAVAETVATAVLDSYEFGLSEGWDKEMARSAAISENGESAACYIGLGSCLNGGCKH